MGLSAARSESHADRIRRELQRITTSPEFADADRLVRFLGFVVEEALVGRGALLKESVIGVEVFGRDPDYDPKVDPVVRVQARRLRTKLDEYYQANPPDGVRIALPKGGYVPEFVPVEEPSVPAEPEDHAVVEAIPAAAIPTVGVGVPIRPARHSRFLLASAVAVIVAAGVAVLALRGGRPNPPGVRLFTAYPNRQANPAFSPDGMTIAFSWGGNDGDNVDIYVQRLDADSPRRLTTSTAVERRPAWMPDGQRVSFLRDDEPGKFSVAVVSVLDGSERILAHIQANTDEPPSLQWSSDGKRLYTAERASPAEPLRIVEIAIDSGTRRILTNPPPGTPGDNEVALSPDGKSIAFRRATEAAIHSVYVQPVNGGASRLLMQDTSGVVGCAWTRDGRAVIVSARHEATLRSLWQFPVDGGSPVRLTDPTEDAYYPAVSPRDGTIAYAAPYLNETIYRIDLDAAAPARRIIASNLRDSCPHYSPDGRRIAFRSTRTGADELWVADGEGGSPARLTNFGGPVTGNARWSPDGQFLALDSRSHGNADVFVLPSGGGTPRRMTQDSSNEVLPSYSADGKWIYFASDRTANWQIWKLPAEGGEARQVTLNGGFAPLESPDGQWVYYTKRDSGGLYRMPIVGGRETVVLESLPPALWGGWGVTRDAVVYISLTGNREDPAQVNVLTLATGATRVAATLRHNPVGWDGTLGVSPDGKYALVAEVERAGSEIHLRPER